MVRDAPVRIAPVDLSAAAETSARTLRDRESRPRITVQPGLTACADPVMVRQVFDNLLGNATKYVAPGVRAHVHVTGRDEGRWTVLSISDNGVGIPDSQRERVFAAFHRAHADDYRGTGLGLAIVRRAVERCDGEVRIVESSSAGTTFEVRLPPTTVTRTSVGV